MSDTVVPSRNRKVHIKSDKTKTGAKCGVGAQWSSCDVTTVKDWRSPRVTCLRCISWRLKIRKKQMPS